MFFLFLFLLFFSFYFFFNIKWFVAKENAQNPKPETPNLEEKPSQLLESF